MAQNPATIDESTFPRVLEAVRTGEQWAAELLYRDMHPRVLRFLRSTEPRAADDLAGEVWLAMARGVATFEGDLGSFRAWVFSIARRRLADLRRTAARRRTDPVDPTDHLVVSLHDDVEVEALVVDDIGAQEAADLIARLLPEDQAEVLLLRVIGGLDVAQVAELMERTPNWVRVTQHRALRKLANHFPPESAMAVMPAHHETI